MVRYTSISRRLAFGFAVTSLALIAITGFALYSFTRVINDFTVDQTHHQREVAILLESQVHLADAIRHGNVYILMQGDRAEGEAVRMEVVALTELVNAYVQVHATEPMNAAETAAMTQLRAVATRLLSLQRKVEVLVTAARYQEALDLFGRESDQVTRTARNVTYGLLTLERRESEALLKDSNRSVRLARIGILLIVLAATALGAVVAWSVRHSVTEATRRLLRSARRFEGSADNPQIHDLGVTGESFEEMLKRLESACAEVERFLADVSHELRTPITIVRGHLEVLRRGARTPDQIERALAISLEELDRMTALVNDLLVLARANRPDFLTPEPIHLSTFLPDLLEKATAMGERNWQFGGTPDAVMVADRDRLTQVLLNLLRNAMEHTPQGALIEMSAMATDGRIEITVRDKGEGVPDHIQPHVFERFRSGTGRGSRMGLGLSIAQAVARAHGGEIAVRSAPGDGSAFTVVLPLRPLA